MDSKELFSYRCRYLTDVLTFEERRSMGLEEFHKYVEEHIFPIPKEELIAGETYTGYCRNARRVQTRYVAYKDWVDATWDGKVFHYTSEKFGSKFEEKINHYEDDNGMDVFIPIKEI